MLRKNSIVTFLFIVFSLLFEHPALTMDFEEDSYADPHATHKGASLLADQSSSDDDLSEAPAAPTSLRTISAISSRTSLLPAEDRVATNLKKYFNKTVLDTRVRSRTTREVSKGAAVILAALPTANLSIPAFLGTFRVEWNITDATFPSPAAIVTAIPAPLALTAVAAWNGAGKILTKRPPDVVQTEHELTDRAYSWYENLVYSWPGKLGQGAFWGMVFAGIITYLESDLEGWGPYYIWATAFSLFFLLPTWVIFDEPTNNPNENPFRHYEDDETRKIHEELDEIIESVMESIRDGDLENTERLLALMNILNQENPGHAHSRSPLLVNRGERLSTDLPSTNAGAAGIPQSLSSVPRDAYLDALDEIISLYSETSYLKKSWRKFKRTSAKWGASVMQVASLPGRSMLSYGIPYLFFHSFMSDTSAEALGILSAIIFTYFNIKSLYKEIPFGVREGKDILSLLYPPNSPPYWNVPCLPLWCNKYISFIPDRLPSLAAVATSVFYISLPIWMFARHQIFEQVYDIHSFGWQLALLLPVVAGTPYAAGRQFAMEQFSIIGNWISTGMQVDMCCNFRAIPCCKCKYIQDLLRGQACFEKLGEIRTKLMNLNSNAVKHIANNVTLPSKKLPLV